MRYLLLALLLTGCDAGQMATAAPPTKETIVEALERYQTLSIERQKSTETKVDSLAETVGNNTAELEGVKEQLKALKSVVEDLRKLLTLDAVPPVSVPQAVAPVAEKPEGLPEQSVGSEPKPEGSVKKPVGLTFQGKPIDVQAWLRRSVTTVEIRGDVDKHLRDHGLDGDFSGLSRDQKIRLHSVAHTYNVPLKSAAPRKVVVKPPVVMNTAVVIPQASGCANGNCQRYGIQTRQRLFGRAWR